jgi:hypothetical protein
LKRPYLPDETPKKVVINTENNEVFGKGGRLRRLNRVEFMKGGKVSKNGKSPVSMPSPNEVKGKIKKISRHLSDNGNEEQEGGFADTTSRKKKQKKRV